MGKIFDALEKYRRERPVKPENLPREMPRKLYPENAEVEQTRKVSLPIGYNEKLVVLSSPHSAEAESFRILKGNLLYPRDGSRPRTIMVSSALPGEGKTHTTANLGVSLARGMDEYVLLIDCDLRQPSLHDYLGLKNTEGLHEFLVGQRRLEDLILNTGVEKLSLLPAGSISLNATELLSSLAMEGFMKEVKNRYHDRVVLLDTPPINMAAEIRALVKYVDTVILVVMARKTPWKAIQKSLDVLGREKILGVVFNGYNETRKHYRKYYEKYYKK